MSFIQQERVLLRSAALHRLSRLRNGVRRMRNQRSDRDDPVSITSIVISRRKPGSRSACIARTRPAPKSVPPTPFTKDEFGIVHSANTARCIACSNCVDACPFGVPKKVEPMDLMMKCNMCYDRTSAGKKPMCATVCPSGALFYGTREKMRECVRTAPPSTRFDLASNWSKPKSTS